MGKKTYLVTTLLLIGCLAMPTLGLQNQQSISSYGTIAPQFSRLHTEGRWIKNKLNQVIRLKGAAVFWRFMYAYSDFAYDPLLYKDEINETSLDLFASTGANFLRLTINGWLWLIKNHPNYINAVDTVIKWCKTRNIMVVLDNHGWFNTDADEWYKSNDRLAVELEEWKQLMIDLASRYKDEPTVIGFDVLNEPGEEIGWDTWISNVLEICQAIHAVDPNYLCFVEPLGSSAEGDAMNRFKISPLPETNIVYCAHRYLAWDYPRYNYAVSYANGDFNSARQQMEDLYYETFLDMLDAGYPVMNMETGVYKDLAKNPNWEVWMDDSLALYEKYNASVCWFPFDPDRTRSSVTSILSSDRISLTTVGEIWRKHMSN